MDFLSYLKELIKSAANTYSVITLVAAVVIWFFPIPSAVQVVLNGIFLLACFLSASYLQWVHAKSQFPEDHELILGTDRVRLQPSVYHGQCLSKVVLSFELDITNKGSLFAMIERPIFKNLRLHPKVFKSENNKTDFSFKDPKSDRPSFPFRLGGNDKAIIHCELEIESVISSPHELAQLVEELVEFSLEVILRYKTLANSGLEKSIIVHGDFNLLKQSLINKWKQDKQHELVCIAKGV